MTSGAGRVLVVDDELHVRESLVRWLVQDGYEAEAATSGKEALALLGRHQFEVVISDIKMPGMDGLELQRRIHEVDRRVAVILITAYASVPTAVQSLKEGAYDYVTKPFDPGELSRVVEKACAAVRMREENVRLKERLAASVPEIVMGQSSAMHRVLELVDAVATTDATVLILGESGTGKELITRLIHAKSQRCFGPLVAVNCGALPEGVLESELFGHEKGSFTGALARRKGKLELADGGTLFLDEVAEISPKVQVELLRTLEDKKVVRVGGSQEIAVDFRVICATNRDLDQVVRDGGFREDLYYRIHVFVIEIPPLRERPEDILPVAEHFLARFAESMARKVTGFSEAAKQALMQYSWPGNVRELANAVERALVVCRSGEILPEHLPIGGPSVEAAGTEPGPGGRTLREVERQHIQRVLAEQDYNISHAAKLLGIDRVTLYNKMRRYEIQRPE